MAERQVPFKHWIYFILTFPFASLRHKLKQRFCRNQNDLQKSREEVYVKGRVVVITGANTGLGKQTALEMARRGAVVVMGCRDSERGTNAMNHIVEQTGADTVELYNLDLADLSSVECFAAEVLRKHPVIDILIKNAGIVLVDSERQCTKEGWDVTITTNYLSHFLLTNLLMESLSISNIGRVVTLSSSSCMLSTLNTSDLMMEEQQHLKMYSTVAYFNSKFCNALFTKYLASQYPGVKAYSLCPGLVKTEVFRHFELGAISRRMEQCFLNIFALNVEQAMKTILLCSIGKQVEGESTGYFRFGKRFRRMEKMLDDNMAKELWNVSETFVKTEERKEKLSASLSTLRSNAFK